MKIRYSSGNAVVEVEAETQKDAFRQLADAMAILTEKECGVCKSRCISHEVREVEGHTYYSMVCECGAQLNYGQHKNGTSLFVKRDKAPATRGWYVWKSDAY